VEHLKRSAELCEWAVVKNRSEEGETERNNQSRLEGSEAESSLKNVTPSVTLWLSMPKLYVVTKI